VRTLTDFSSLDLGGAGIKKKEKKGWGAEALKENLKSSSGEQIKLFRRCLVWPNFAKDKGRDCLGGKNGGEIF